MTMRSGRYVACLLLPISAASDAAPIAPQLAEACLRFTPRVALRGSEALFLELAPDLRYFEKVSLRPRLEALARRFGVTDFRIAMGRNASEAFALARWKGMNSVEALPLEALLDFLAPFHPSALDELSVFNRMLEALRLLGLSNFQDFSRIPEQTLSSRFGKLGLRIKRALQSGSDLDPWPLFQPTPKMRDEIDLRDSDTLSPCSSMESLAFVLRIRLDRVTARLRGRALRVAALSLEMKLEDLGERRWELQLPIPQGSTSGILPLIRERIEFDLSCRRPLTSPVTQVLLEVTETAPGHGAQRDFFSKAEEEAELWDSLMGRLWQKLGPQGAFIAEPVDRHLPERAWKPSTLATSSSLIAQPPKTEGPSSRKDAVGLPPPQRPSRVLSKPELVRRRGDLLQHSWKPIRWKILHWLGPERISGEWWGESDFSRDYFRVITESGEKLWVFSQPTPQGTEVFLHGYFD